MHDAGTEPTLDETHAPARRAGTVTVRYWASARAAAGRVEDTVEGAGTMQGVLDGALSLHPDDDRFARVLAISSLLLGDRPVRREELDRLPVSPGDVVEVLPPFAGG
jgi:sulfur-carrier protein